MNDEKPKIGRPEKLIDWKLVEQLCHIQCTHEEIASFCHITKDTLYDRAVKQYDETFSTVYKRYSEGGKSSLRRHQFRMSEKNCSMAIWLGKQYLGQREPEVIHNAAPQKVIYEVNYKNDSNHPVPVSPASVPATDTPSPQ